MALYELHQRPEQQEPVLVMALEGWIDAGLGGGGAMAALLGALDPQLVATFDSDILLDYRARRPMITITDGVNQEVTWPQVQLRAGRDAEGRDVLVLTGPEPDHQWRAFADGVCELAGTLGVRMVVGLGAFPAPVPHTRPAPVAATATDGDLVAQVGFVPGTVNVPGGVQAVLERRFAEAGVPAMSLWARVPHYVSGMPYPEASARLLEALSSVAGITVDTTDLREAAANARRRIDDLMAGSEEHLAMLRQLEAQADAEQAGPELAFGNLPTGDELAAELERFLRDER